MKFWYKKARRYMHLYAESQREYKKLNEKYQSQLNSNLETLRRLYDLTVENAQLKILLNKCEDAISFMKPRKSGIMIIDELEEKR